MRAAIRTYQRLGGLNNRTLFSHSSGGWKSKIKVAEGLVCTEDLSPWLADGHLLAVSLHGVFLHVLHVHVV